MPRKTQRVRDPVHDLVVFEGDSPFDQLIWDLLNAPEFQRLRRIRQLGFSEFVFPSATHTRFSHSVGVFHGARHLMNILENKLGEAYNWEHARAAATAALVHDVGHGPFSHTFESVMKAHGAPKNHERWTAEIIRGDTVIGRILDQSALVEKEKVVEILEKEDPIDIYASIVSSQFDADRMDYLRRDKMMTGTAQGSFDWSWLLDCIEIDKVTMGGEGEGDAGDIYEADALILNSKGLQAAEGYLLGRFHLYSQVYMHKTTRAFEKMLGALFQKITERVRNHDALTFGDNHPFVRFVQSGFSDLGAYLDLDDFLIWSMLKSLSYDSDLEVAELARRIQDREPYKCVDIGARAEMVGGDTRPKFKQALKRTFESGKLVQDVDVLTDEAKISAYKFHDYESSSALEKILIRRPDGTGGHDDLRNFSNVVESLESKRLYRVYGKNEEVRQKLEEIWEDVK